MILSFRSSWLGLALSACLLGVPGESQAGAGVLSTVVTPLSPIVTYSRAASATSAALRTQVGYEVRVGNLSGNTINSVRFTGSARATDADEAVRIASVDGAACSISASRTSLECNFGQLKAGQAVPVFAIFFDAPQKDTLSPIPDGSPGNCVSADCVHFSGITYYAEGTGGAKSVPQNSTTLWSATPVPLGTFTPELVKSAVPKTGGSLFTGNGAAPTGSDKFTTAVTVPSANTYTTAEIRETDVSSGCISSNFSACFRSAITIPGFFTPDYLRIVVRQDASTLLGGAKIEQVLVQYSDGLGGPVLVGDCASPTTPRSDGLPCIAERVFYKNSRVPGWTTALDGDFEWRIISRSNGSYTMF